MAWAQCYWRRRLLRVRFVCSFVCILYVLFICFLIHVKCSTAHCANKFCLTDHNLLETTTKQRGNEPCVQVIARAIGRYYMRAIPGMYSLSVPFASTVTNRMMPPEEPSRAIACAMDFFTKVWQRGKCKRPSMKRKKAYFERLKKRQADVLPAGLTWHSSLDIPGLNAASTWP